MTTKIERRIKIKYIVRKKISGTPERPRMSVFRRKKQIYVQFIDDLSGKTLAAASSLGMEVMPKKEQAAKVGELIAKKAQEAGITTVVFDRNGYLYHGRVKEVADAARNGKKEQAAKVGELIAKKAQEAGITTVVFDRNGYLYHGRVKEVADAARNGGLKF